MLATSSFGTIGFSAFTVPVNVCTITGLWRGTAAAYVQIHDRLTVPTGGMVPVMSIPVAIASPFAFPQFINGGLTLRTGCWVGFSTAEAIYAAVDGVGQNVGTMFVEVDDYEVPYLGTSSATSSGSDSLTVWSTGGPKRLVQLTVTIPTGSTAASPLIFSDSGATQLVSTLNVQRFISSADDKRVQPAETKVFKFSSEGIDVSTVSSAGVLNNNCYIKLSTSPTAYLAPGTVTGNVITALYR